MSCPAVSCVGCATKSIRFAQQPRAPLLWWLRVTVGMSRLFGWVVGWLVDSLSVCSCVRLFVCLRDHFCCSFVDVQVMEMLAALEQDPEMMKQMLAQLMKDPAFAEVNGAADLFLHMPCVTEIMF